MTDDLTADLAKADALLREWIEQARLAGPLIDRTRAYLATRPAQVDPIVVLARKLEELALRAIKLAKEHQA